MTTPTPDFARTEIMQALYSDGWTCDAHEPDPACEYCRELWGNTADRILARVLRAMAREALDGYAKTLDDLTAPAPHLEAERVRHYRDTHHPTPEETP